MPTPDLAPARAVSAASESVAQLQQLVAHAQPALPELASSMQAAGLMAAMADWSLDKMAYVQVGRVRGSVGRRRSSSSSCSTVTGTAQHRQQHEAHAAFAPWQALAVRLPPLTLAAAAGDPP